MTLAERQTIERAVADAEEGTTGRIAVRVIPDGGTDALVRAKHEFEQLGLRRHPRGNAALFLVAPKARRFAIVGDRSLHERVGDAFWADVVEQSRPYFARGEIAQGIAYAVGRLGAALHEHFPEASEGHVS